MLPSAEEAKRLKKAIPGCRVRYFKESGHTLLLEGDLNLGSVIKSTGCYRRGKTWDPVNDYVMLTRDEYSASYNSLMSETSTSSVYLLYLSSTFHSLCYLHGSFLAWCFFQHM
jgi:hypothetical protein